MYFLGGVERGKVGVYVFGDEGYGLEVVIVVFGFGVNEYWLVFFGVLFQFIEDVGMVDVYIMYGVRERWDVQIGVQIGQGIVVYVVVVDEKVFFF